METASRERIAAVREGELICAPMPQYQCHKKVWALKIAAIERVTPTIGELEQLLKEDPQADPPGAIITPVDPRFGPFFVSQSYVQKHNPQVGGYYVQYEGGYKSWSPAQAFEEGYTRI